MSLLQLFTTDTADNSCSRMAVLDPEHFLSTASIWSYDSQVLPLFHAGVFFCNGLLCRCDQLVNETTVVSLTREMLNYLVVAIPEHKGPLCSKIAAAAER